MKSYTFAPPWQLSYRRDFCFYEVHHTPRTDSLRPENWQGGGRCQCPFKLVHLQPTTFHCIICSAAQVGRHFLPLQALRRHYLVFVLSTSCFLFCILAPRFSPVTHHSQLSHSHGTFFFFSLIPVLHKQVHFPAVNKGRSQAKPYGCVSLHAFPPLLVTYSLFSEHEH